MIIVKFEWTFPDSVIFLPHSYLVIAVWLFCCPYLGKMCIRDSCTGADQDSHRERTEPHCGGLLYPVWLGARLQMCIRDRVIGAALMTANVVELKRVRVTKNETADTGTGKLHRGKRDVYKRQELTRFSRASRSCFAALYACI